jgi:hypothetical protein
MTLKELKEEYRRQYEDKEITWDEAQAKLKARVDFKFLVTTELTKIEKALRINADESGSWKTLCSILGITRKWNHERKRWESVCPQSNGD